MLSLFNLMYDSIYLSVSNANEELFTLLTSIQQDK